VYRDIEIESTNSLHDLAEAIIAAFEFDFDHAFGFYSGSSPDKMYKQQPKYELFVDIGEESDGLSVKKTTIGTAFPEVGHTMTFLFDYGDEWLFNTKVIRAGKKAAGVRYPRLIGSKGEAPPQYADPDDDGEW
jgi:hypothetical protein